jgi:histidine ammonia-lyase
MIYQINPDHQLNLDIIQTLLFSDHHLINLSQNALQKITQCREYLDEKIKAGSEPIYGINTGFGALYQQSVSAENLSRLQHNLVMSHACGMGEEVPSNIVKLMLILKVQSLSYGNSGVSLELVQRLVDMHNNNVIPVVYQQGSLGASGDLAPLAHLSLPLIGMGEVYFEGKKRGAAEVLDQLRWKQLKLQSKEGLALLNGTQFMAAYGIYCLLKANNLLKWSDIIAAISLDAFDGRIEPFHFLIQRIRPHQGQSATADRICSLLKDSEIISRAKAHVQDPYSFRCMPQVHGASKNALDHVTKAFLMEINSVTDNPTLFPDEDLIISAGNFHGQPLALTMDYLAIALAESGNISERRVYQLISGKRGLPPFLVANPGINSGFMIPQYTAASIVSQNKQLCTPASVDSIESSNGQEDHVSMGANAATKLFKVVENLERLLAIELFTAAQALEFRRPLKSGSVIEDIINHYRKMVPFINEDEYLHIHLKNSLDFIITFPPA